MLSNTLTPASLLTRICNSSWFLIIFAWYFIYLQSEMSVTYTQYIGTFDLTKIPTLIYFVTYTLICYLAMPVLVTKIFLKENLQQLGWTFPKNKKLAIILILISLTFLLPYIIHFSNLQSFHGYSLGTHNYLKLLPILILFFPTYYIAEEFFFRGFLFIALWNRVGWHSFWITDIIFTLSHVGKPWQEVLMCIPLSIILNCMTLATRSIVPAVVVHATLGVVLSILVTLGKF